MAQEVLIVDDSDFMRGLLREILNDEFEVVAEATNGIEAVDAYRVHEPDVVMMDLVMPIRDGVEATEAIISLDPDAYIIMCTSVGQEDRITRAIEVGASGFVTKPFQKPSIIEELSQRATA